MNRFQVHDGNQTGPFFFAGLSYLDQESFRPERVALMRGTRGQLDISAGELGQEHRRTVWLDFFVIEQLVSNHLR